MDTLFRVKLQIPVLQHKLAARSRLDSELNAGLGGGLTLVTAPAGYGKTTAVVKWVEQLSIPAAWFSIDEMDNSPKRFWKYFTAAIGSVIPGLEERFNQYFASAAYITAGNIITPLIDEIYKHENSFVIILDDYHLITEPAIHEGLALLVRYLPETAHLVITSRVRPSSFSIRQQTIGRVKELGLTDLQFSRAEITSLCEINGIKATVRELNELENLTEGWAAGLYLLLDSADKERAGHLRPTDTVYSDKQRIASYLSEEVIGQWGEEEKSFLLKTSVLQTLTGSLCDILTGRRDGAEMLRRLADNNAFIITLDYEGGWYRYHHLFSEYLYKLLKDMPDSDLSGLHSKAGAWYEGRGYFAEAIGHYLRGLDYERAAEIIEKRGRELLKAGVAEVLLGWLESLPPALLENRDKLCLTYAWSLIMLNRQKEAISWVERVEARLNTSAPDYADTEWRTQLQVELVAARGFIELKMQNSSNALKSAIRFQEIMSNGSIFLMSGINFNAGGASIMSGIFGLKGRLSRVEREYLPIFEKARSYIKVLNGYIPIMLGEILFERNQIDGAISMLVKGGREAEESRAIGGLVPLSITYAKIFKSRGDIKGAFAAVHEGQERLRKIGAVHLVPLLSAFEIRLNLETCCMEDVESWMSRNCLDIFSSPNLSNIYEYLTLARVYIAKREFENCLLLLNKIKLFAEEEDNLLYTLDTLILLAIVHLQQGFTQTAMDYLRQALEIGESNGYERIFIEEGVPMASLLGRFIRRSSVKAQEDLNQNSKAQTPPVSPVYVRRLLKLTRDYIVTVKAFRTDRAKTAGRTDVKNVELTKRERDILQLLNSELTNAEIAYTLDISVNTVKVNCSNIYRKLNVKNRTQAVSVMKL